MPIMEWKGWTRVNQIKDKLHVANILYKKDREGFKKNKKKIMENSIIGGRGGVSEGNFPYSIFFWFQMA